MRRKLFLNLLVAIVFLLAYVSSSFALRTSRPNTAIQISVALDDDGNEMTDGVWVYGITMYADTSTACVAAIYDCDTTAEVTTELGYPKFEIGEPTQYEVTTEWFEEGPVYYEDGVSMNVGTCGKVFIHYGPAPE